MFSSTKIKGVVCAALLLATVQFSQQVQAQYCTTVAFTGYVPQSGSTYFAEDQYSRYLFAYFSWMGPTAMEWFLRPYTPDVTWSAGTYEHQHIFYNYDGKAYGNAPSGYWDSNMPSPYVDTQMLDSPNEKNITIGSAHARDFGNDPFAMYRYTTRFTSGGGTSSLVKIQAQRGLRAPTNCYSTYCSVGCDTQANYINVVPFQSGFQATNNTHVCWRKQGAGNDGWWTC